MTVPNLCRIHAGFMQGGGGGGGGALCAPLGMIIQKYPGADRVT